MRTIIENVSDGKFFMANIGFAVAGLWATFNFKDWAQIFAAIATGVWFITQTVLAIKNDRKKRASQ